MMADLALLAQAVAPVGAGLAYVMNPKQAAAVRLYRGALWSPDVPILASIAVPDPTGATRAVTGRGGTRFDIMGRNRSAIPRPHRPRTRRRLRIVIADHAR